MANAVPTLGGPRRIEPFSFWPAYASAIPGFGGNEPGPDPLYCFHTPYTEFAPGHVVFRLRLTGARASHGELSLRVHAYRTDQSSDAMMVAGSRLRLDGLEGDDREVTMRFLSLPGVGYALFGRYGEQADLTIEGMEVTAEELGDTAIAAPPTDRQSNLADGRFAPSGRLFADGLPSLRTPVCQPCTPDQLLAAAPEWAGPELATLDPLLRWSIAIAWQMLANANLLSSGTRGAVLDLPCPALVEALVAKGCLIGGEGPADFIIARGERLAPEELANLVLPGGVMIALLPCPEREALARNRLQRIALRLIGQGCNVAQICWPSDATLVRDASGGGIMALLARR